jgi:hypothetical protein
MANDKSFGFKASNSTFGFELSNYVFGFQFAGISFPQILINAFIIRVTNDGGTYEAESCQLAQLTALNDIV